METNIHHPSHYFRRTAIAAIVASVLSPSVYAGITTTGANPTVVTSDGSVILQSAGSVSSLSVLDSGINLQSSQPITISAPARIGTGNQFIDVNTTSSSTSILANTININATNTSIINSGGTLTVDSATSKIGSTLQTNIYTGTGTGGQGNLTTTNTGVEITGSSSNITATSLTGGQVQVDASSTTLTGNRATNTGLTLNNNGSVNLNGTASGAKTAGLTIDSTGSTVTLLNNVNTTVGATSGHGLTIGATSTTLTGGTNSSIISALDGSATIGVGTATTPAITVINASNTNGNTSFTSVANGSSQVATSILPGRFQGTTGNVSGFTRDGITVPQTTNQDGVPGTTVSESVSSVLLTNGVGGVNGLQVFENRTNLAGDTINLMGDVTIAGNITLPENISAGNITARNNLTSNNLSSNNFTLGTGNVTGNLTAGNITSRNDIIALNNVSGINGNFTNVNGNVTSTGTSTFNNLTAGNATVNNQTVTNNLTVLGNATLGENVTAGNITARNNLTSNNLSSNNFTLGTGNVTGNLTAGNITSRNDIIALNNVSGINGNFTNITAANGNITNVTAQNITANNATFSNLTATGNVSLGENLTAGNITARNNLTSNNLTSGNFTLGTGNVTGNLTAGNITSQNDIIATNNVSGINGNFTNVNGNVTSTGNSTFNNLTANGNSSFNNVTIVGNLTLPENISAGNITARNSLTSNGTLNVTGQTILSNVTSGNLTNTGNFTNRGNATFGNITTTLLSDGNKSIVDFTNSTVKGLVATATNVSQITGDAGKGGPYASNGATGNLTSGIGAATAFNGNQTVAANTTIGNRLEGVKYQNLVNGNELIDGNLYVNGNTKIVGTNTVTSTVDASTNLASSKLAGATTGVISQVGLTTSTPTNPVPVTDIVTGQTAPESVAAVTLTNGNGQTGGLQVFEDRTLLSGGTSAATKVASNGATGVPTGQAPVGSGAVSTFNANNVQTAQPNSTIGNQLDGVKYQTLVNGSTFVDGNLYVNGDTKTVGTTAATSTVIGGPGTSKFDPAASVSGQTGIQTSTAANPVPVTDIVTGNTASESVASTTLTNGNGQTNGLQVFEDRTNLSGGGNSVVVDNNGVTIRNSTGQPAKVTGVADGTTQYDAVNFGQLQALSNNMDGIANRAYSGIAQSAAINSIPTTMAGHHYGIGIGSGFYSGQQAIAFGGTADVGEHIKMKAAVANGFGSSSAMTANVGAGFSW